MDFSALIAGQTIVALINNSIYTPEVQSVTRELISTSTTSIVRYSESITVILRTTNYYGADAEQSDLITYIYGGRNWSNGETVPAFTYTGDEVSKFAATKEGIIAQL